MREHEHYIPNSHEYQHPHKNGHNFDLKDLLKPTNKES